MVDIKKEVGERLKKAREAKNLKQNRVAKYLGVHNSTVAKYESGEREADLETIKKLAELYEVSIDWILGNEEKKTGDYPRLSDEATEFVVREICKKYNIDPTDPIKREKLEKIIEIVYGESND